MSEPSPLHSNSPPRPWYLNAYLHVGVSTAFAAIAQPLMKKGSEAAGAHDVFAFTALASGWLWLGIFAILTSLVSWIHALRTVPLNIAFNLAAFVHVLVPLLAWLFLGESISLERWAGIGLVAAGVVVVAHEAVRLESRL